MIDVPYHKETIIGVLGDVNKQRNGVCGLILHGDKSHEPLWWNGGFRETKYFRSPLIKFTSYMWEPDNGHAWQVPCLQRSREYMKKLSKEQLKLIETFQKYNCSDFTC